MISVLNLHNKREPLRHVKSSVDLSTWLMDWGSWLIIEGGLAGAF
ncbi:hypothetical protein DOT_3878 [Desulfosporosinus sp. OT]|nr:hypothetical protein DOT_3878 [Desulfosporosinus sp. OT]